MAVTTQYSDIITAARLRSIKRTSAVDETELFDVAKLAFTGIFAVAARVNPYFFGDTEVVVKAGGGWMRPTQAASIVRVELDDVGGAEVAVVDLGDRQAELGMPAVYRFGQKFISAGNADDPDTEDLAFWFAKFPVVPTDVDDVLDPLWIEHFNQFFIDEVALYLSLKDRRLDELGELRESRKGWLRLFVQFLEHETANVSKRFGQIKRIPVEELFPLLAGGAA